MAEKLEYYMQCPKCHNRFMKKILPEELDFVKCPIGCLEKPNDITAEWQAKLEAGRGARLKREAAEQVELEAAEKAHRDAIVRKPVKRK